jgi:hypothetical protein
MSLRGEIPALSSTTSSERAIIDVDSVHFDMPAYNAGSHQECNIQYLCKHKHLHTGPITATTAAATVIKDNSNEPVGLSTAAEDFSTSSCSETEDEDSQAYRYHILLLCF